LSMDACHCNSLHQHLCTCDTTGAGSLLCIGNLSQCNSACKLLSSLHKNLLLKVRTIEACVSADACALDLAVYSSHSSDRTDIAPVPVNALRNRALAMATTEVGLICQRVLPIEGTQWAGQSSCPLHLPIGLAFRSCPCLDLAVWTCSLVPSAHRN